MPEPPSTRLGLVGPSSTDDVTFGDDVIRAIIARLELVAALVTQGTTTLRPATTVERHLYLATDTGVVSWYTGGTWVDINPADTGANTPSMRTLGTGAAQAAAGNDPRFGTLAATVDALQAALTALVPPGTIIATASVATPAGYLPCDGTTQLRATYTALFAAISTAYNTGLEPGTHFRLPNFLGRVPVGADPAGGVLPNSNRARGQSGGAERHALDSTEMPAHNHVPAGGYGNFVVQDGAGSAPPPYPGAGNMNLHGGTAFAGGSQSHNNMQPYQVVNYAIKF